MASNLKRTVWAARTFLIIIPPLLFMVAAIAFFAHSYFGFLAFFAIPLSLLIGFGIGVYAFVALKCGVCGKRFVSVEFPVWPFQSGCNHCGSSLDEA